MPKKKKGKKKVGKKGGKGKKKTKKSSSSSELTEPGLVYPPTIGENPRLAYLMTLYGVEPDPAPPVLPPLAEGAPTDAELAQTAESAGDLDAALAHWEQHLERQKLLLAGKAPGQDVANTYVAMADIYAKQEYWGDALEYYDLALDIPLVPEQVEKIKKKKGKGKGKGKKKKKKTKKKK
eukprot:UC1_evm3s486